MNEEKPIVFKQFLGARAEQEDRLCGDLIPPMDELQARRFLQFNSAMINDKTHAHSTGSTFTGAIVTKDGTVATAQLGDSFGAILIYDTVTHECHIRKLTQEQKPTESKQRYVDGALEGKSMLHGRNYYTKMGETDPEERFPVRPRVITQELEQKRMVLMVKAAFGDYELGMAVSHQPDVQVHTIPECADPTKRVYLMVGCDGVGEYATIRPEAKKKPTPKKHRTAAEKESDMLYAQEDQYDFHSILPRHERAIQAAFEQYPDLSTHNMARDIVMNAFRQEGNGGDNASLAIMELKPGVTAALAVFDGHGGAQTAEAGKQTFDANIKLINKTKSIDLALDGMKERLRPMVADVMERRASGKLPQPSTMPSAPARGR